MTDPKTRNAAIAAACIMLGFGFVAYWMPTLMLALGERSTLAAGIFAVVFVAGSSSSSGCAPENSMRMTSLILQRGGQQQDAKQHDEQCAANLDDVLNAA